MKKNRIFGALSAAALLFTGACSNDVLAPEAEGGANGVNPEDGVYLAVTFDLPSAKGTRSYTDGDNSSSSGTEVGTDEENKVTSSLLVLATTSNEYIASALAEDGNIVAVGSQGDSYKSTNKFTKTELNAYYQALSDLEVEIDKTTGNHKINVFVFCNPTEGLLDVFKNAELGDTKWVNAKGVWQEVNNTASASIWEKNKFLMGNSAICTRLFPSQLSEWDEHTEESTAFNLSGMNNYGRPNEIDNFLDGKGAIEVERAAARYDFRDGALDTEGQVAQTYHVLLDSDEKPLVDVKLEKMSMVNMNKDFFFLSRVSNNGREGDLMVDGEPNNYRLLGPELPWYNDAFGNDIPDQRGNYVVDADSEWKYSGNSVFNKGAYSTYFNFPLFNDDNSFDNKNESGMKLDEITGNWYTNLISDVLGGSLDTSKKYHIWRYLTEGTIPGISSQKNGVSNGVAFKGIIQPARAAVNADDDFTKKLLSVIQPTTTEKTDGMNDPILFLFGNHLYATWDHVRRAAIGFAINELTEKTDGTWTFNVTRSSTLYNAVFGNGGFGTITFKKLPDGKVTFLTTETEGEDIVTITDELAQDTSSPNYLYNEWKEEPAYDEQYYAFRSAAVAKKFYLYTASWDAQVGKWGYYCNYYYWNRHNDNGQNGVMGPMEFAVVRNNVYKLAVTKLSRIGHPQDPKNDPEVPTPNTPDESGDVYITVTCTTLPWVVRENTIEF